MPAGSDILTIGANGDGGVNLLALCTPNGLAVWHPMTIALPGEVTTPLLGKKFGPSLGVFQMEGKVCALLPELPWPTAEQALQAADPKGSA